MQNKNLYKRAMITKFTFFIQGEKQQCNKKLKCLWKLGNINYETNYRILQLGAKGERTETHL